MLFMVFVGSLFDVSYVVYGVCRKSLCRPLCRLWCLQEVSMSSVYVVYGVCRKSLCGQFMSFMVFVGSLYVVSLCRLCCL